MGMPCGKNAAQPAGHHLLAGLEVGVFRQVAQGQQRAVERPAGLADDRRCRGVSFSTSAETLQFGSPSSTTCERVRLTEGDPADQAFGGQHRQVHPQAVAAAEVNLHRAPPVGRLAQDDLGQLEFPGRLSAASRGAAGAGRFRGRFPRACMACSRSCWFSRRRRVILPEQFAAAARRRRPALPASCWEELASPNSGRNRLPMASLKRAVVWPGRFKIISVNSTTRPKAM